MKALTICQPYAHLIVRGDKRVENRTWPTRYRGDLVIHAGKSTDWLSPDDINDWRAAGDPMVFGAIVGWAKLVACLPLHEVANGEHAAKYPWLSTHEHTEGPWCWVLDEVNRFDHPFPWKGAQGLWEIRMDDLAGREFKRVTREVPHVR